MTSRWGGGAGWDEMAAVVGFGSLWLAAGSVAGLGAGSLPVLLGLSSSFWLVQLLFGGLHPTNQTNSNSTSPPTTSSSRGS